MDKVTDGRVVRVKTWDLDRIERLAKGPCT